MLPLLDDLCGYLGAKNDTGEILECGDFLICEGSFFIAAVPKEGKFIFFIADTVGSLKEVETGRVGFDFMVDLSQKAAANVLSNATTLLMETR